MFQGGNTMVFLKNFLDEKQKLKRVKRKCYDIGYEEAVKHKNKEIKSIHEKYQHELKERDFEKAQMKKRVCGIEEDLNNFDEILCDADSMIKKVKRSSYIKTMMNQEEQGILEGLNHKSERTKFKFNKIRQKIDSKIVDFKTKNAVNE
jgi:hypothetical protein